jgi:hypothetical protein
MLLVGLTELRLGHQLLIHPLRPDLNSGLPVIVVCGRWLRVTVLLACVDSFMSVMGRGVVLLMSLNGVDHEEGLSGLGAHLADVLVNCLGPPLLFMFPPQDLFL